MLLLRRRVGESIVIGEGIRITVTEVRGGTVRIAIDAPSATPVHRAELLESLGPENERAVLRRGQSLPPSASEQGVTELILTFPSGILGLGSHRDFVLYDVDETHRMLVAKDDPTLRLLVTDPTLVDPNYPIARALARYPFGEEDIAVATVVTRPADGSASTVNLAAPLLIGMSSRKAAQVILDDGRLSLRAPLVPAASELAVNV
jgi:carbon storage regulator CsrA